MAIIPDQKYALKGSQIEDLASRIGDNTGDIETLEAKIQALATDFSYKGSVEDYAHLPSDAATGDVYTTTDTGIIYVWDGNAWVALNEYPSVFVGTDGTSAGEEGLVPAPTAADAGKVLGANGTWVTGGPNVVQTTGTSTTDVMSQDGVSKLLFGKYNNDYDKEKIQIGKNASATAGNTTAIGNTAVSTYGSGIAIGYEARDAQSSVGLGAFSQPASRGEVNIGIPRATSTQWDAYGHNNTPYRLLTGVSDPESAHDAATKGYVDANAGGPTVVQTIGTSTTDVMSQNAASSLIYSNPASPYDVRIGNANVNGVNAVSIGPGAAAGGGGSVAIGAASSTGGWTNSVALGRFAQCTDNGQVNIGMGTHTTEGYSGSAYRLLSGLYDPQTDHDAATKHYVDANTPTITMTTTDPGEGAPLSAGQFVAVY